MPVRQQSSASYFDQDLVNIGYGQGKTNLFAIVFGYEAKFFIEHHLQVFCQVAELIIGHRYKAQVLIPCGIVYFAYLIGFVRQVFFIYGPYGDLFLTQPGQQFLLQRHRPFVNIFP